MSNLIQLNHETAMHALETISHDDKWKCVVTVNDCLHCMELSYEIERGIFEYCIDYCTNHNKLIIGSTYEYITNRITNAIKSSKILRKGLLERTIDPHKLAYISPSQLCPEKWADILEKKHNREERGKNIPTTNMYKCRKCLEKKCTISFLQTRSSDEPMTMYIHCCVCGNTWTGS